MKYINRFFLLTCFLLFIQSCKEENRKTDSEIVKLLAKCDSLELTDMNLCDSFTIIAQEKSGKSGNKELIVKANIRKIANELILSNYDQVKELVEKTKRICTEHKFEDEALICDFQLGCALLKEKELVKAIKLFNRLIPEFKKRNNYQRLSHTINNLGLAQFYSDNFDNSIIYYTEAIAISETNNYEKDLPDLYQRIGIAYAEKKQLDSSEKYFSKAKDKLIKQNNLKNLAYCENNIAGLYYMYNKPQKAIIEYKKALENFNKIGLKNEVYTVNENLGMIYQSMGIDSKDKSKIKLSIEYILKAIIDSNALENPDAMMQNYFTLGFDYEQLGEYKKSVEAFSKAYESHEKTLNKSVKSEIEELNDKYQLEKKNSKIVALENEKLISERKFILALAIGIISLLLIGSVFYNYIQRQKKNAIIAELKAKKLAEDNIRIAEENERIRIGKDLHDTMGAYASSIIAGVDNLKSEVKSSHTTMDNIRDSADNLLLSLRENILILSNKDSDIIEIFDQFKNFSVKLVSNYKTIDIEFIEDVKTNLKLSSLKSIHLQALMKEIIHNAIKHSQCSKITCSILELEDVYQIKIEDNGIGFDSSITTFGEGKKNIQWRINHLQAKFDIDTANSKGTKIIIELKKD